MKSIRVGQGYDVHRLEPARKLWLGGIEIPHSKGAVGHSDADVLIHVICDALLGAAGLRDIGFHFPDTDPAYKDIDSKILLRQVVKKVVLSGYSVGNVDATVVLQTPKINHHIPEMAKCLSQIMDLDESQISIKATTTEKLGFVGLEQGIAAFAVALIYQP